MATASFWSGAGLFAAACFLLISGVSAAPRNTLSATLLSGSAGELEALHAFKNGLANAAFDPLFVTWKGSKPCTWSGIECNTKGNVKQIDLSSRPTPLEGTIASDLGLLTKLEILNLRNNNLCGAIPSELLALNTLTEIKLQDNIRLCNGSYDRRMGFEAEYEGLNSTCVGECPTSDEWAPVQDIRDQIKLLLEFRDGISTYASTSLAEWEGDDPCVWPGIKCWDGGMFFGLVQAIKLPAGGLVGSLSSSLTKIGSLQSLRLEKNHLCGMLPEFQTTLSELELFGNSMLCGGRPEVLPLSSFTGLSLDQACVAECPPKVECTKGQFLSSEAAVCMDCQNCQVGEYRDSCGVANPGKCTECGSCSIMNQYRKGCTGTEPGTCTACRECPVDEYRADGCSTNQDSICKKCGACETGKYRAGCRGDEPGTCETCPLCPDGQRRVGCSSTSVGMCVSCFSDCPAEQFRTECTGSCQECALCPAGEYKRHCSHMSPGVCETCAACAVGEYRLGCEKFEAGVCTTCVTCAGGQFRSGCDGQNPGVCEECGECSEGTYRKGCSKQSAGECKSCPDCPAGTYNEGCSGSSQGKCMSCGFCPHGSFRGECTGLSPGRCLKCTECPSGQFLVGCEGLSEGKCQFCQACAPGQTLLGCKGSYGGKCVACEQGQYERGGKCFDCPAGHTSTPGSTKCTACPVGAFATASRVCEPCSPGTFNHEEAAVQCTACPKGFMQAMYSQVSCERCKPGSAATSAVGCTVCPAGTFSDGSGCKICQPGFYSDEGSSECTPCEQGQFADAYGTPFSCRSCPSGQISSGADGCLTIACPPNSVSTGAAQCTCKHGYEGQIMFSADQGAYRGKCDACLAGTWSAGTGQCHRVPCPMNSRLRGESTCACDEGFSGEITWSLNRYVGSCTEEGCPVNSVRVDDPSGSLPFLCECAPGFQVIGEDALKVDLAGISGTCARCPKGFASEQGGKCTKVECPGSEPTVIDFFASVNVSNSSNIDMIEQVDDGNAGAHPECRCNPGSVGKIEWDWNDQAYTGKCVVCAPGSWSFKDTALCTPVICPENAGGYPDCACREGFEGQLKWNRTDGKWDGKCTACEPGFTTNASSPTCSVQVECPANSTSSAGGTCTCMPNYSGDVTWDPVIRGWHGMCSRCPEGFSSAAGGSCSLEACPVHSSSRLGCSCNPGYTGTIGWDVESWAHTGECTACPAQMVKDRSGPMNCSYCDTGMHSPEAAKVCEVMHCPKHSSGWPECQCVPGYSGSLWWEGGEFRGECTGCPAGYTSIEGGACFKVECPTSASMHPACSCPVGYSGTVTWDSFKGMYLGDCVKVECPMNAFSWPNCVCDVGASGTLEWAAEAQDYVGSCQECPSGTMQDDFGRPSCKACGAGFFSDTNSSCVKIECPAHSSGHPACMCDAGYVGKATWDRMTGSYTECKPCSAGEWSAPGSEECYKVDCPRIHGAKGVSPLCECEDGGKVAWNPVDGAFEGLCFASRCPANALSPPHCMCAPGYVGPLDYNLTTGVWSGECKKCAAGKWSGLGENHCQDVVVDDWAGGVGNLFKASAFNGEVLINGSSIRDDLSSWYTAAVSQMRAGPGRTIGCPRGYAGVITFSYGEWSGKCTECATGFDSADGERSCAQVMCPPNAAGHPDCRCNEGFDAGKNGKMLAFDKLTRKYSGVCKSCKDGMFSTAVKPVCERVKCPANAEVVGDFCQCKVGFEGDLSYMPKRGVYFGQCVECPKGYTSEDGTECTKLVTCPAGSSGHPHCTCDAMMFGNIEWDDSARVYEGSCTACAKGTASAAGSATCTARGCPAHSVGWPECKCEAGYHGKITFFRKTGNFMGSCTPCAAGSFSDKNGSSACTPTKKGFWTALPGSTKPERVECPPNAEGFPSCKCMSGFSGKLSWHSGVWTGSCSPCATGYWSQGSDEACVKVECPKGGKDHPNCICRAGSFSRSPVRWNNESGRYQGGCQKCPNGYWSEPGVDNCTVSVCPSGSEGHPNCKCKHGHAGMLTWSPQGFYEGSCFRCAKGTRPVGSSCRPVPCPVGSTGHPDCKCNTGRAGVLTFDDLSLGYFGECKPCPPGSTTPAPGSAECTVDVPCPANSLKGPNSTDGCICMHGFLGEITWMSSLNKWAGTCSDEKCPPHAAGLPCECNAGFEEAEPLIYFADDFSWSGECRACPLGAAPGKFKGCEDVACPGNATGHPYCACMDGFAGSLVWGGMQYEGTCTECQPGSRPASDSSKCEIVSCPPNSFRKPLSSGTGSKCVCAKGHEGKVTWNGEEFIGSCSLCPIGLQSLDGSACKPVGCPPYAKGFPNCRCAEGYGGELTWRPDAGVYAGQCIKCPAGFTSPLDEDDCVPVSCPDNAVHHPNCVCDSPVYAAKDGIAIKWVPDEIDYSGSCIKCEDGGWSLDGLTCLEFSCPLHSSGARGQCTCDVGYYGEIVLGQSGDITGSCEPCETGFTNEEGGGCFEVACPENAEGHPDCQCKPGYEGLITWNLGARAYLGTCQSCLPGLWSEDGGVCSEVVCPEHAEPAMQGGGCECIKNYEGELTLVDGEYVGICTKCGKGYASESDGKCTKVACPAHSINHPHCACAPGYGGEVVWEYSVGKYVSECYKIPLRMDLPSASSSSSTSPSPSASITASATATNSLSPTPSASPFSPTPSPSTCIAKAFTLSGATCMGCNGEYVVCDKRDDVLEYCLNGRPSTTATLEFFEGKWRFAQFGKVLYSAAGGGASPPPLTGWVSEVEGLKPVVLTRQCTHIFTFVLEIFDQPDAIGPKAVGPVVAAVSKILHVSPQQMFSMRVEDNMVFFGVDLSLTPSLAGEFVLDILKQSTTDNSLAHWLSFFGLPTEGSRFSVIEISDLTRVDRLPKVDAKVEYKLYPQLPVIPQEQDTRCVAGSVWCKPAKGCIDATAECSADVVVAKPADDEDEEENCGDEIELKAAKNTALTQEQTRQEGEAAVMNKKGNEKVKAVEKNKDKDKKGKKSSFFSLW